MSVVIVDYGSQYSQLIARHIRQKHIYCRLVKPENIKNINTKDVKAWILSGSPSSVTDINSTDFSKTVLKNGAPVLGICYGFHILIKGFSGEIHSADKGEYGHSRIKQKAQDPLFEGVTFPSPVWMSHGDSVKKLPEEFIATTITGNNIISSFRHKTRAIFGLQFHPEVSHTQEGEKILGNFLINICKLKQDWTMENLAERSIPLIRKEVGDSRVICALSGGVDSSVAATLVHRAIGDNLYAIFVDNGLIRKNEWEEVAGLFKDELKMNVSMVNARDKFLSALSGVTNPEEKRKIIGHKFIEVFDEASKEIGDVEYLVQGTLYPDVIESVSHCGASVTIKSHHNVGGLPEKMRLKLIEPLRELFKDGVRELGRALGLPAALINRHPFPGPGLGIRVLGEITNEKLHIVKEADDIVVSEIKKAGYYDKVWQAFAVLLPVKSVGVMGDARTYDYTCVVRAVESRDAMTADWARLPAELLANISNRIVNEVRGINRVVYDITTKPPGTIEWE